MKILKKWKKILEWSDVWIRSLFRFEFVSDEYNFIDGEKLMRNFGFGKFWIFGFWMRILESLVMGGRSRSGWVDARSIGSAGPRSQVSDQIQVHKILFGPSHGPWQTLPATLPRLGSQLPELYGHGGDPTPAPRCTTTGTDPHPDPALTWGRTLARILTHPQPTW